MNEGIDVPDANCLVFLRNTESPVVFLQQLGRGLRKVEGKDRVLVLDFVNNLDRFNFVYSFYSRLRAEQTAYSLRSGNYHIPDSSLYLDQTARDIIATLIKKKERSGYIVELSSLVASFDYKVSAYTLRHLVEIGKIIPDFIFPSSSGQEKMYLEKSTVYRFLRQTNSAHFLEGLIPEREAACCLGKTVKWIKRQEKYGYINPSWIHRRINGYIEFYFTEEDINGCKKLAKS